MNGYYKAQVCGIDAENGCVRVTFPERGGIVSEPLPLLAFEYNMPKIGEWVGVIINSDRQGICLGKIFSNSQKPEKNSGYYKKTGSAEICADNDFMLDFGGGASVRAANGVITIRGKRVIISEEYND